MAISRRSFLKTAFSLYAGILVTGCVSKTPIRPSALPLPQKDPRNNLPWPEGKKPSPKILSCPTCATLCYASERDEKGNQVFKNGKPKVLTDKEGNPLIIAIDIPYTNENGGISTIRNFKVKPVPLQEISNSIVSMTYKNLPPEAYPILFSGLSEAKVKERLAQISNEPVIVGDLKKASQLKKILDKIAQNAQAQIDQTPQAEPAMQINVPVEEKDLNDLGHLLRLRQRFFDIKIKRLPPSATNLFQRMFRMTPKLPTLSA